MSVLEFHRTAITGSTGHLGANLIPLLLGEGYGVRAHVFDNEHILDDLDVERVRGNVLDKDSLLRAFDGVEVVFHLAALITLAYKSDLRAHEVNVEGTRNVIEACKTCRVRRLIHFSSIHALSAFPLDEPIDESRQLCDGRAFPYDRSKAAADRLVLEAVAEGLDAIIVTPTGVIGPQDVVGSYMGVILHAMYARRIRWVPAGGFNWVDARDVCQGALAAARIGKAGERYIFAGQHVPTKDFAVLLSEVTDHTISMRTLPQWVAYLGFPFMAPLRPFVAELRGFRVSTLRSVRQHQLVSDEKARRELAFTPRDIRETLRDTIEWFGGNGRGV